MSASALSGASLLQRIVAAKRSELQALRSSGTLAASPRPHLGQTYFESALRRPAGAALRVIAECKKASPSMGLIRPDYDPAAAAQEYRRCGASALSVLTDREFFQGDLQHLAAAAEAGLPLLRKDFIIAEEQILEARLAGADAVLLIVRILNEESLGRLLAAAAAQDLAALVEVHNESEAALAAEAGARLIGINHRDLDTLQMDLSLSARIAPALRRLRPDAILIAESGVEDRKGLAAVQECADAVLIGTAFMKSRSISAAWQELFA
ncbi:MAG: indole-3-glycerol phosphate synthase TrpC [Leptospirales bacterium]|nr:indole-3-glycerol phosphate synthase TrpC [Leptospirales bacterium]